MDLSIFNEGSVPLRLFEDILNELPVQLRYFEHECHYLSRSVRPTLFL